MALFHKNYRETPARRVFKVFNYIFCTLIACLCLFPMLHILALSFSRSEFVNTNQVVLWPKGFNTFAYRDLLQNAQFFTSMWISVKRVALGLVVNMSLILLCAYPLSLSRERFGARQFYVWFFVITMLFGGGLIPTYLVVSHTGLLNSLWALVLPGCLSVYNMIVARTFFKSNISEELYEAGEIDGCTQSRFFFQIALPLSKAIIAIMVLYYGVGHWNSYFSALLYISDQDKYPLQLVLRNILITNQTALSQTATTAAARAALQEQQQLIDVMKYSLIIISSVPVLIMYPLVQKHFVKGVMIGSVKG